MNEFLSDYYGTNDGANYEDPDSLEKMAQLTLLVKEAEENDVDLSELTEDEALELADELYGENAAYENDFEKEAAAKFEEADYLGRVMAHSMWQELDEIEKQAGPRWDKTKDYATRAGKYVKELPGRAYRGSLGRVGEGTSSRIGARIDKGIKSDRVQSIIHRLGGAKGGLKGGKASNESWQKGIERVKRIGSVGSQVGAGVGAAGAAGAAGYGGYRGVQALRDRKGKKKKASAFYKIAEDRALEMLYEGGYIDEYGNVYGQEKVASDFDSEVDVAALQMLEEQGWPVQWNY